MIGTSWMREQFMGDPLFVEVLRARGIDRLNRPRHPRSVAAMKRWEALAALRDGPVNPACKPVTDLQAQADDIKRRARELGADDVGMTALRPEYVSLGVELPHDNVIVVICKEDYARSVEGADAVEVEAMETYAKCAEISTELARYIREDLGYAAMAHHNGLVQVMAIPIMHQIGFGELGKHGSLIHPELGSNFRPGSITTTLPVAYDSPIEFGVQDYCLSCNLCQNNCPADAIPSEFIITDGVRRWLTDIEKCYSVSRLRPEYCHLCVDVCPYIHKMNGDATKKSTYRTFMQHRKAGGYKTAKNNSDPS
jgi:epoxyqueuosine reductase